MTIKPDSELQINEIIDKRLKSDCTLSVLKTLPDWFGNERAVEEYASEVTDTKFWAAFDRTKPIGFFSIKTHYGNTGEIYVCGIDPNYHNKGIGTKIYFLAENYLKSIGCSYVVVKTLSDMAESQSYSITRKFYKSVEFSPLLTLTEMWDEENPCLIMIKSI